MIYYSPSVKQCLDRKGKPWRATVYFNDPVTQKKKQKTKMLPDAKGKRDALKMAMAWTNELNETAQKTAPAEQEKTVREIIQTFEDYRLATGIIEKSSYQRDLLITKNYINPYLGNYLFTSVDRIDITKWLTDLYKRGLAPTTIRNAFAQLKKVYSYYADTDQIEKNPFKGVKTPKSGGARKTHLTTEQMDSFLAAVYLEYTPADPMYCGCLLAYYSGLRRGEICGLRWRNIDFDKKTITVDSAIGNGSGGNYTKPPKNNSSNRTFPMLPQLYDALKARHDAIKPKSGWFVIGNKEKFMSLQAFTDSFQKFADAYELKDYYGKRITPHGLRHNLATVGIRSGMDIASLSLMMGHASRAMTLDTYGDANPDALTMAAEKLGETFKSESTLGSENVLYKKAEKTNDSVEGE